ncbi:cofilin-2 [Microcaecilia unicolor]|uniref:Cofilin-2-like n=1 Tax=Microcaecilia unicolor TaxID=1415580 RepID=A0A6P7ZAG7_9AMPH|nr:cofilin-2-like [Microcaecilia unicolor]
MASGVTVSDAVLAVFNDMKVRKACSPEDAKKRKKYVCFRLSDDQRTIIVDEECELLVGDVGEKVADPYKHLVNMLPKDACRYVLYDACYETKESKREDLVFIMWVPEDVPIKQKMLYASSKDSIRRKFPGLKCELQINNTADLLDRRTMAEKLSANVVTLEGKPL